MKQVLPRSKRLSCSEVKRVSSCCCEDETLNPNESMNKSPPQQLNQTKMPPDVNKNKKIADDADLSKVTNVLTKGVHSV